MDETVVIGLLLSRQGFQSLPGETWRFASWCADYIVSSAGRAISLKYDKVRLLKPQPSENGHLHLVLSDGKRTKTVNLHVLVAELFIGPRPDGLNALHRDDDKTNNAVSNIYYGTQAQNRADCIRNGTNVPPRGSVNGMSKLTEDQVARIKEAINREIPYYGEGRRTKNVKPVLMRLALEHGISYGHARNIRRYMAWRHLDEQNHSQAM